MANISKLKLPNGNEYDLRAGSIPYGEVDSTSTSTAFTATVEGITELVDGTCVLLKNGVVTSASGFTININGLGAKNVYNNMAAATAETTIFNVAYTMLFVYDSTRDADGGWICYRGYNSDTTTGREEYYYLRPYAGQAVYRYKFLMQGEDGRFYPITTTNQSSATQVTKTPTTTPLRPWKIWYYTGTATVSAGAAFGAQTVQPSYYNTTAVYNFNASTGTYAYIFLQGSYNKDTDLFTLDSGSNYYKFVRYNTAINWSSSGLVSGKYYILLGSTYSTTNYVQLFNVNPFYYFDGTKLIPVYKKTAEDLISEKAQEKLVSGTNIKTINGVSVLGSGNISISGGGGGDAVTYTPTVSSGTELGKININGTPNAIHAPTIPTNVSSFVNDAGYITGSYVSSVNGNSGAVTVTEGLTPLIGDTDDTDPTDVKTALLEGRDICILRLDSLDDIPLALNFTSWNSATDTVYGGYAIDVVLSHTIARYNGVFYLFELVGEIAFNGTPTNQWYVLKTALAQLSDIPTKSIVQATGTAATLSLSAGAITQIPLNSSLASDTTNVTFDTTLKGIKILEAGLYKLQASVYINAPASAYGVGAYIYKASNSGAYSSASELLGVLHAAPTTSQSFAVDTPMKMVQLEENDILYMSGRCVGAAGTAYPSNAATFLYVEQV